MTRSERLALRADLLRGGHTYTSIARELGVCPQHVQQVAHGRAISKRVRDEIKAKIGRDPWENEAQGDTAA